MNNGIENHASLFLLIILIAGVLPGCIYALYQVIAYFPIFTLGDPIVGDSPTNNNIAEFSTAENASSTDIVSLKNSNLLHVGAAFLTLVGAFFFTLGIFLMFRMS